MTFAQAHPRTATGRAPSRRPGRDSIPLSADTRSQIQGKCETLGEYVSAAVLWFHSLTREDQVERIQRRRTKSAHRRVEVVLQISDIVRQWSFPIFTMSRVVEAAVLDFYLLPGKEQREWIKEAAVFIGDPRQAPKGGTP